MKALMRRYQVWKMVNSKNFVSIWYSLFFNGFHIKWPEDEPKPQCVICYEELSNEALILSSNLNEA